ncbi:MAG: zf-HC2 domain-containing protein [Acidobacteriota bacterium]
MDCVKAEDQLSAYIDGELSDRERMELESHLQTCKNCRKELEEHMKIKKISSSIKFAEPPKEMMDNYWTSISAGISRGTGWTLFLIGTVILIAYAIYQFVIDRSIDAFIKTTVAAVVIGIVMLFVSVLIERLRDLKTDRYRGVEK